MDKFNIEKEFKEYKIKINDNHATLTIYGFENVYNINLKLLKKILKKYNCLDNHVIRFSTYEDANNFCNWLYSTIIANKLVGE
ncbi:MAG: hypothetical protein ACOCP8_01840 [archaeon]